MKKLTIVPMIAAMILLAVTVISAKTPNAQSTSRSAYIQYEVTVHLSRNVDLCNTYLVVLVDKSNQLVAPAQQYVVGMNNYYFHEIGPVSGYRIADLVMADQFKASCVNNLSTHADAVNGKFVDGKNYIFNLYPRINTSNTSRTK